MGYPKLTHDQWKWLIPNYLFYNDEYISSKLGIPVKDLNEFFFKYYPDIYKTKRENIEEEYAKAGNFRTRHAVNIRCPYFRAIYTHGIECAKLPTDYTGIVPVEDVKNHIERCCKGMFKCPQRERLEKE